MDLLNCFPIELSCDKYFMFIYLAAWIEQIEKVIKHFHCKVQMYLFSLWECERRCHSLVQDSELHSSFSCPALGRTQALPWALCPGELLGLRQILPSKIWLRVQLLKINCRFYYSASECAGNSSTWVYWFIFYAFRNTWQWRYVWGFGFRCFLTFLPPP